MEYQIYLETFLKWIASITILYVLNKIVDYLGGKSINENFEDKKDEPVKKEEKKPIKKPAPKPEPKKVVEKPVKK